jgi:hypothetical protein
MKSTASPLLRSILLWTFILASLPGFSQKRISTLKTNLGELSIDQISQDDVVKTFRITVGDVVLANTEGVGISIGFKWPEVSPKLLLLKTDTGGNGCEESFQIVDLSGKRAWISSDIGLCSLDFSAVQIRVGSLQIKTHGTDAKDWRTWTYAPGSRKLLPEKRLPPPRSPYPHTKSCGRSRGL